MSTFHTAKLFKEEEERYTQEQETKLLKEEYNKNNASQDEEAVSYVLDRDIDSEDFFSPSKGNVAFASAYHGWGFRINDFAELFHKKMGMKKEILQQALWGSYYLDPKTKKIKKKPVKQNQENMFVQFIMSNIYNVYDAVLLKRDEQKMDKIIQSLGITFPANFMKRSDHKQQLKSLMTKWLPLSDAILSMVVDKLPSPKNAQKDRILKLIPELEGVKSKTQKTKTNATTEKKATSTRASVRNLRKKLKKSLLQCESGDNAEVMVFVSKMMEVDSLPDMNISFSSSSMMASMSAVRQPGMESREESIKANTEDMASETVDMPIEETPKEVEEDIETHLRDHFVGFARIFSGTIKLGQKLHVLGPLYNPNNPDVDRQEFTVTRLYMIMGRELLPVEEVPAGNVFAIGDVGQFILKSATIASSIYSPIFSAMHFIAAPIVRFAIEPVNLLDMPKLVKGLKLLNQADPSVRVLLQITGEHVIMTAGEVHAERCITDLNERFARIPITISPPIVSFRETVVPPLPIPETDKKPNQKEEDDTDEEEKTISTKKLFSKYRLMSVKTANKLCTIKLRAIPLPENISRFIDENAEGLKPFFSSDEAVMESEQAKTFGTDKVLQELKAEFENAGPEWAAEWDNVWSLGPRRIGPNILLNHIAEYKAPHFRSIYKRASNLLVNLEDNTANTITSPNSVQSPVEESTATSTSSGHSAPTAENINAFVSNMQQLDTNFIAGFQLATNSGPLCGEPMQGVCFCIESVVLTKELSSMLLSSAQRRKKREEVKTEKNTIEQEEEVKTEEVEEEKVEKDDEEKSTTRVSYGTFGGQVMSAIKEGCRKAFDVSQRRLVEAVYKSEIQATSETVGNVYNVLRKRRADVQAEDVEEGTGLFIISALLPVAESFGFSNELRDKSSGAATAQLTFSHWQILDVDPFYEPRTEDELEEFGQHGHIAAPNIARDYINGVRQRKGLMVDKKIVESSEKQRNRSMKK
jgi:ribosome assembly protein 1